MIRLPPKATRTDTLFPYTTLFRSQVLERLGIDRGAVAPWAEDAVPEVIPARGRFANLALRPPGGTARWHRVTPGSFAGALEGVRRVDCADPGEEALVIDRKSTRLNSSH